MKKIITVIIAIGLFVSFGGKAPASDPSPVLPPLEDGKARLSAVEKVYVKGIRLEDNTVFSDEVLGTITAAYENREITAEELQELKDKLTRYYVANGYINSGAIILDQDVRDGIISLQIIEGKLTQTKVSGNTWLRDSYISKRLELATRGGKDPLNVNKLQQHLKLLKQDPRIDNINANLGPGLELGQSILDVEVDEARPYHMTLRFNNYHAPSIGSYSGEIDLSHLNLTGWGDSLSAHYALTEGLDDYSFRYAIPLTRWGTTLSFEMSQAEAVVVSEEFKDKDIRSETENYSLSLHHPFYKTLSGEFSMGLTLERSESKTFMGDDPFPFTSYEGDDVGVYKVTPLRFYQEWVKRSMSQVIALRSTFSFGLDMLDATVDISEDGFWMESPPNAEFITWLGQFQWLRRLKLLESQLLFKLDMSLSNDPLLPVEKFAIGGSSTVRGYRENLMTTDNGLVTSLEWRVPLGHLKIPGLSKGPDDGLLQLCPFFDFGHGWNVDNPDPSTNSIYSTGIGARWTVSKIINAEIYWGKSLKDADDGSDEYDIQDDGIHFQFNMGLF